MECILALDIGGSKLLCGALTPKGRILSSTGTILPEKYDASELFSIILDSARNILSEYACGVCGIAIPGLADAKSGTWIYAPYSGISDFKIAQMLENKIHIPVYVENDVNACAIGERHFGLCREVDDFIWITVSNGIGGSVFANGELYNGAFGNAGEIGHFKVVKNGRLCGCGARGCVEAEAAGPAISAKYFEQTGIIASAKDIAEYTRNSDRAAESVYEEAGYLIGCAVGNAANLLNPALIVFGGGVSMDFELLKPGIDKGVGETLFCAANREIRLEKTALGYNAALRGAAALAI